MSCRASDVQFRRFAGCGPAFFDARRSLVRTVFLPLADPVLFERRAAMTLAKRLTTAEKAPTTIDPLEFSLDAEGEQKQ